MHLFRPPRTLGDHLVHGVARALVLGIGLEAAILATAGAHDGSPDDSAAAWSQPEPPRAAETRLMERYDCSHGGYPDSAIPQSAIVRDAAGRLRVVSFSEGWQVFTSDHATKTLIAVCLEPRA